MTFSENPSSAKNDRFDQAGDYGMILLFTKYPNEISLEDMATKLKSPACSASLKRTMDSEDLTDGQKHSQFLRYNPSILS